MQRYETDCNEISYDCLLVCCEYGGKRKECVKQ